MVWVDHPTSLAVAGKAAQAGVCNGVALTLLVELELLEKDLVAAGLHLGHPPAAKAPELRLSAAEACYLRRLNFRRPLLDPKPSPRISVPVRLLARLQDGLLARAIERDLDHAIRWEVAALTAGRTINELGLLIALRANAAG
jgi:hypothetical protein